MRMRVVRLQLDVTVPDAATDQSVEEAVNGALNEPPCDWDDWIVGAARTVAARSEGEAAEMDSVFAPEERKTINDVRRAIRETDKDNFEEALYEMYCDHGARLVNEALRQLENEPDR